MRDYSPEQAQRKVFLLEEAQTRALTKAEHDDLSRLCDPDDDPNSGEYIFLMYPPQERPIRRTPEELAARIEARRRADREKREREKREERRALHSSPLLTPVLEPEEAVPGAEPEEAESAPERETSEARVRANRQNAQKSTGPKSPEGKARASRNAFRHGLYSNDILVFGEDAEELNAFREEWMEDLAPEGPRERFLADHVVGLAWRLCRAERMEGRYAYLHYQHKYYSQFPLDQLNAKARLALSDQILAGILTTESFYPNLVRTESGLQREFYRATHELDRLRAERTDGRGRKADDGGRKENAECRSASADASADPAAASASAEEAAASAPAKADAESRTNDQGPMTNVEEEEETDAERPRQGIIRRTADDEIPEGEGDSAERSQCGAEAPVPEAEPESADAEAAEETPRAESAVSEEHAGACGNRAAEQHGAIPKAECPNPNDQDPMWRQERLKNSSKHSPMTSDTLVAGRQPTAPGWGF